MTTLGAPSPPAGVHPWHDIPVGPAKKTPDVVHAVIEIPEGSKVKYEIDKVLSCMPDSVHRSTATHYALRRAIAPVTARKPPGHLNSTSARRCCFFSCSQVL
jgi:hypothetical protein